MKKKIYIFVIYFIIVQKNFVFNYPCRETSLRFPRSGLFALAIWLYASWMWRSLWPCWQKTGKSSLMWETNTLCLRVCESVCQRWVFMARMAGSQKLLPIWSNLSNNHISIKSLQNHQVWLIFKKLLKNYDRFKSKLDFCFFWRKCEWIWHPHSEG